MRDNEPEIGKWNPGNHGCEQEASQMLATRFVASEIGPNYWRVWWEVVKGNMRLMCDVVGAPDPEPAIKQVKAEAKRLGVRLPDLDRRVWGNTKRMPK